MEIVAMEMKLRCMNTARLLSFKDVTFKVDEVSLTPMMSLIESLLPFSI